MGRFRTDGKAPAEHKQDAFDSFSSYNSKSKSSLLAARNMVELGTIGALALSVFSSVSIVVCNKYLISNLGFHFATTLTCAHMAVTAAFLHLARMMRWFEPKAMELRPLIIFSTISGISIGFLNLSLGLNSVGFYQMTKLAIIPCTVTLQSLFYGKRFGFMVKVALGVLLGGVGVATVTDLQLNFMGSLMSLCAVATTCISQIWTNTLQKRFSISSTQLLYNSAPYQALVMLVVGPLLDNALTVSTVLEFEYTNTVVAFALMSCLIAICVNFSTFLVIGKCDAVTYQVLGHVKTMLVLGFGFVVLQNPFMWRNIGGIAIALVGMVAYGIYEQKDQEMQKLQAAKQEAKEDPEKGVPLLAHSNADLSARSTSKP